MGCEKHWDGQPCLLEDGHEPPCAFACAICGGSMGGDEDSITAHRCPLRAPSLGADTVAHLLLMSVADDDTIHSETTIALLALHGLIAVMGDHDRKCTVVLTLRGMTLVKDTIARAAQVAKAVW